jgi:methyltransferase
MSAGAVHVALALYLVILVVQRAAELVISSRHARALAARGGREHGAAHFPWIVALHALAPLALVAEVLGRDTRPGPLAALWLALWLAAQGLRYAAMSALGERWTVRVWTVPGERPVRRGIYRLIPHPNYLAVALELLAAPMMFGAWLTAMGTTIANGAALAVRIRSEERALAAASAEGRAVPPLDSRRAAP